MSARNMPTKRAQPQRSSSWREAFSRGLPQLRSFARTIGPPLAVGPQSLLHPCRGRFGGSRWSVVDHRRVSTTVKAAHHHSSCCWFVGSGLPQRSVPTNSWNTWNRASTVLWWRKYFRAACLGPLCPRAPCIAGSAGAVVTPLARPG